jgi:hypothetical protein
MLPAFAFLMLALAAPAAAQGFGIEAGITRASLRGDSVPDFIDGRNGWLAGIWFGGNRTGRVGLMGELTYVVKGDEDVKLQYIEVPVLMRVNIGSRDRNSWTVYPVFGPVFDIKLKAEVDDLDLSDEYEGFDVGVMAGAGFEFARIGVEVRGNWGLRSIDPDLTGSEKVTNYMLQALLKIRIN